jgi:hypothetical protein
MRVYTAAVKQSLDLYRPFCSTGDCASLHAYHLCVHVPAFGLR